MMDFLCYSAHCPSLQAKLIVWETVFYLVVWVVSLAPSLTDPLEIRVFPSHLECASAVHLNMEIWI